jgi:telomerase reverse transcriptase
MTSQRKRKHEATDASSNKKCTKIPSDTPVRRDLLERCYNKVTTLREYVLLKLPNGSRLRRKKVASVGEGEDAGEVEKTLSRLLDTSLVCFTDQQTPTEDTRWEQWLVFSQREDESYVSISDGIAGSVFSQSEVGIVYP